MLKITPVAVKKWQIIEMFEMSLVQWNKIRQRVIRDTNMPIVSIKHATVCKMSTLFEIQLQNCNLPGTFRKYIFCKRHRLMNRLTFLTGNVTD